MPEVDPQDEQEKQFAPLTFLSMKHKNFNIVEQTAYRYGNSK